MSSLSSKLLRHLGSIWHGKAFPIIITNTICQNLGEPLCQALPFYYAFTGCDTTSQLGKGKKSVWEAWKSLPNVTDAFQFTAHAASISCAGAIFTYFSCWNISHVILYDRTTLITKVNELRQELFSKRSNSMESIPPTQVKLAYYVQCSLANANSVKAKFRITRILTTSPCIAPIKTCTIKVLLSRIPLNKKFCLTSTSLVEPFVL